jgi:hypothetical protein
MFLAPISREFRLAGRITAGLVLTIAALTGLGTPAGAQMPAQIKLTEQHLQGFIAAQKPMSAVTEKMQGSTSDKPDPKIQGELDAVAKKNGFKDFAEYDQVAASISMVMAGIDPDTKQFTDAQTAIKKEIAEVEADRAIPANERKQMLEELNDALRSAKPVQYPENIALVIKYYDKIEEALE